MRCFRIGWMFFALLFPLVTLADEPVANPAAVDVSQGESIRLEVPARSVDEALKRLASATEATDAQLSEARAARDMAVADAEKLAIAELSRLAKGEVASGNIAGAAKAWTEVLRLDANNEAATEFFKTIGRLDTVRKELAARAKRTASTISNTQNNSSVSPSNLDSSPQTVDKILHWLSRAVNSADAALQIADKDHDEAISDTRKQAVSNMQQIAKLELANGNIAKAAKVWKEVMRIDAEHEGAISFFKSIGQLDAIRKSITNESKPQPAVQSDNQTSTRKIWSSKTYGTKVVHQQGDDWLEMEPNGHVRFHVKEIDRNDQYIEILLIERNHKMRLFDNHEEMFKGNRWQWIANGSWTTD